jgi:hypothetical protein
MRHLCATDTQMAIVLQRHRAVNCQFSVAAENLDIPASAAKIHL